MTQRQFDRIRKFLKSKYGIDMSNKATIVNGRLENFMIRQGFEDYDQLMDAVDMDFSGDLEKQVVNLLTTNHTYFMRETEHFDYLKNVVLPYWKPKLESTKNLRIWCAASSSGEEPYTLAMVIRDFLGFEVESWDMTVLATDISTSVLQKAIEGKYTDEQIDPLPETWKRRYFKQYADGDTWEATKVLKDSVMFRKFNLMDPFPFRNKMHAIFIRNVMIYFDEPTRQNLLKKLYDCLEPGGYIFLGRTETLEKGSVPLEMIQPSIYRKPVRSR